MPNIVTLLPELDQEELTYVQELIRDLDDERAQNFANLYRNRRRDPQNVLILSLVGFLGVGGLQRFYLEEIPMGILYILTLGICYIGTIIDIINYRSLTLRYNQQKARETLSFVKQM